MKTWLKICRSPSATTANRSSPTRKANDSSSSRLNKMAKLLTCSKRTHAGRPKSPDDKEVLKSMGYSLGKTIGEGTYSKVCVAAVHGRVDDVHERVAIKIIQKKLAGSEFIQKFLPRELSIIRHLQHKNIVAVHDVIEAHESIYIVLDYCKCGDLLEYVRDKGPLDDDVAKSYFRQIVNAVSYLHTLDIAHRDVKCENVLLSSLQHVKLADFGFARFCVEENGDAVLSDTYCGSAAYAAPEIIQGIPYDPKMYDIWALGCVLYIMISATMPFDDANVKKMLRNQLNRSLCASAHKTWDSHCVHLQNLIAYLLEPDVTRRATIRQVGNCVWLKLKRKTPGDESCEDSRNLPNTSQSSHPQTVVNMYEDCRELSKSSLF